MINYTDNELVLELKKYYGDSASFRDGQMEAIKSVLDGKRTLVVQKTGWGKSLVYFLATKMIRKKTGKMAIIISPLLALMDNQIESAGRLGINLRTINSTNKLDWVPILCDVANGNVDALIISPERLANEDFIKDLKNYIASQIGLFVVDEAHCISDWGHDFRPDYRRIVNILALLPMNIPVLATTATANDRVVEDIKMQLGRDIHVSRGGLVRESISLQTISLDSREERLVWISKHINEMPGTGLIYCLTVNDCKLVSKWLNNEHISNMTYYADMAAEDRAFAARMFMGNKIKALVATVAFGMGYDKPDIGFVIHFQKPGNIVAYYQQIGRVGRQIDQAYAILLYGDEDDEINNYFIESAFPTEADMNEVVDLLKRHPGLSVANIEQYVNMSRTRLAKCLKYLDVNGDIYKEGSLYYKTPKLWKPDMEHSKIITERRKKELDQINQFTKTSQCYMKYISNALDDKSACACGKCSNCTGEKLFKTEISAQEYTKAKIFIKSDYNIIEPRKLWPFGAFATTRIPYLNETGRVLSNYGDAGWGKEVSKGKYETQVFGNDLVEAAYDNLKEFVSNNNILHLTYIPSIRRPTLVKDFAERLAARLELDFFTGLKKTDDAVCQKSLKNSYNQWENAYYSFDVVDIRKGNILLVDDMVDSRWTLTCCGYKLMSKGSGRIYPFALANSAGKGDNKE